MSLLIQCWYSTEENKKFDIAKECLKSLFETVDIGKHRLVIINQNSCKEVREYLSEQAKLPGITVVHLSENIGTARGINIGLRMRNPGEFVCKTDDDLSWCESGWVEKMEREITKNPKIGILGLKRDDVYGEFIPQGNLLWCHDIMGTCTMYNPFMLDKVGFLTQPSVYGFDDSIISVRSEAAGFRNVFMKNIKIKNLDLKETPYTEWKRKEAGVYLQEASIMMDMIKKGELDFYYNGE